MSNFSFLQAEFPAVFEAARQAEAHGNSDPRAACFYVHRALELAVTWLYRHDRCLRLPYREDLSATIHEPGFQQAAGAAISSKARLIKDLGNRAPHDARPMRWPSPRRPGKTTMTPACAATPSSGCARKWRP